MRALGFVRNVPHKTNGQPPRATRQLETKSCIMLTRQKKRGFLEDFSHPCLACMRIGVYLSSLCRYVAM